MGDTTDTAAPADAGATEPTQDPGTDEPAEPAAEVEVGEMGSFTVDGMTISQEFDSPAFGATLDDPFDSGETVDVTWDVQVPDDVRDCSL